MIIVYLLSSILMVYYGPALYSILRPHARNIVVYVTVLRLHDSALDGTTKTQTGVRPLLTYSIWRVSLRISEPPFPHLQ